MNHQKNFYGIKFNEIIKRVCMEELAKKIVEKMNLKEIINTINSEIVKVDNDKKDELFSCITEELLLELNKSVK